MSIDSTLSVNVKNTKRNKKKILKTQPIRPVSARISTVRYRTDAKHDRGDDENESPKSDAEHAKCRKIFFITDIIVQYNVAMRFGLVGRRTIGKRNERHATAHKTEIGPRNYIGGGGVGGYRAARRDAFNPVRKIPTVVPGGYPENYYT